MLQLQDVVLQRGDRVLFDALSLVVHAGQHVGLVGRNGAGKSSLFQIIRQQLLPESGDVRLPPSWRIVHLAQEAPAVTSRAIDFVLDGFAELRAVERKMQRAEQDGKDLALAHALEEYDQLGGYQAQAKAAKILDGLGFAPTDVEKPVEDFSGGWRVRLALAQVLMTPADLMLLDEPTNHLDMEATLWLERWLARFPGTLITIAHDRDFLDRATGYTAHLENGRAQVYKGNYTSFEEQYAANAALSAAQNKKVAARTKEIQAFVDRFRAQATKAKQVQSRLKALAKLETTAVVQAERGYEFEFANAAKVSKPLIRLVNADLGYTDATILSQVNLELSPGARIGVLGKNGAGKSTLLKTLAAELSIRGGDFERGKHSQVGYFAQHQLEQLSDERCARQILQQQLPERFAQDGPARNYLGGWGFRGDDVLRPIASFSGGERARLVLALLAAAEPALLILDEPTNHLDLDMRGALALALQSYAGAVLLVSHDRHLLRQCVDELWLVADGGVTEFQGELEAYERGQVSGFGSEAEEEGSSGPTAKSTPAPAARANDVGASTRERRQQRANQRAATRPLRREIEALEREMDALNEEISAIEAKLADNSIYETNISQGGQSLATLLTEQGQLKTRLADIESAWLSRSEALELAMTEGS